MTQLQIRLLVIVTALLAAGVLWDKFMHAPEPTSTAPARSVVSTQDAMPRFQVDAWQVGVATNPQTPAVGDNTLIVELRDPAGTPRSGATIEAYAEMPAMGAMPKMRSAAGLLRETSPGRYEGELDLSMRGEWPLTVQIQNHPQLGDRRLQFDLATDRAGLTIASGGTPVGAESSGNNEQTFSIDSRRRQLIGLQTQAATHRDLVKTVRAVGRVAYDERLRSQIALKYDGFIGQLAADYVGAPITRGQVLFTVYSPELLAAQQEFLDTRARRGSSDSLLQAARQRLALWDMSDAEIDALARRGIAQDYIPIYAPRSGTLVERHISDGSGVKAGDTLLTIADLTQVWIEADIYEADLPLIAVNTPANITLPYGPGKPIAAQVEYLYPFLQNATRTGRARFTIDNAAGQFKPHMFANVVFDVALGHRLSLPEQAVLVAGDSRIVFVDLGEGRLKPVKVTTGHRAQGFVEIRDGLNLGDVVVTSGNFLVAAEARLKLGLEQW